MQSRFLLLLEYGAILGLLQKKVLQLLVLGPELLDELALERDYLTRFVLRPGLEAGWPRRVQGWRLMVRRAVVNALK